VSDYIAKSRICKSKVIVPDQGPCTDLEFREYLEGYGKNCKCGKNDWKLIE